MDKEAWNCRLKIKSNEMAFSFCRLGQNNELKERP